MYFRPLLLSLVCLLPVACRKAPPAESGAVKSDRPAVSLSAWSHFSGERAMEDVRAQVACGPRPAGSAELAKCRSLLTARLQAAGWEVQEQAWEEYTGLLRGSLKFVNLRARFPVAGKVDWDARARTLVASHYDTKWFNGTTFTGANDGGSSTGLVLEAARAMARVPELAAKVEIVLFDGEEAIQAFTNPGGLGDSRYDGLYGSRYYARQLNAGPAAKIPEFMVLFDIIGHENCVVEFPVNCDPGLVRLALEEAGNMGQASSFTASSAAMVDDHVPLSWVGVNVIDYIALESFRSYWHTSGDSLDKVVPAVLERNGKAGLRLIERITME